MGKEKKLTKGSHFLPKAYLKNFLLNDELVIYKRGEKFFDEKTQPEDRILIVQGEDGLNNVAKKNKLYFCDDIEGMPPDFMEDFFRENVEGEITPLLEKISKISVHEPIPQDIREGVSRLMASTMLRVPGHKALIEELYHAFFAAQFEIGGLSQEEKDFFKKEYEKETGKKISDKDLEYALQRFIDGEFKLTVSSKHFVKVILTTIEHYAA
ncbi:MAG: DUF4238 domain-containing protein [Candidatus Moraniibacteriota bacterium]|nr:MAG: DUF4238 domain-containing protein [Candidatus Moranbacteria bacterium]